MPSCPRRPPRPALPRCRCAPLLGTDEEDTPQEGVLGVTEDGKELVTGDMNQPQAVVIAGQIGYGKTSSIGVVLENGQAAKENISNTQVPYLELVTHYDTDPDGLAPRWANYFKPNDEKAAVEELGEVFGAEPQGFQVKRQDRDRAAAGRGADGASGGRSTRGWSCACSSWARSG